MKIGDKFIIPKGSFTGFECEVVEVSQLGVYQVDIDIFGHLFRLTVGPEWFNPPSEKKQRGGRRSGSGRKPSPDTEKRKSFSVYVPESLCVRIQKYCEAHDCSINQYIVDSIKMRLNK